MSTLVLLVHADPSVKPRYVAALAAAGVAGDVVAMVAPPLPNVAGGGLSSRYDALAQRCLAGGSGSAIKGFLDIYAPGATYDRLFLATFSAGYAFARHLSAADREQLEGLILIDSGHSSKDADGTASDAGVAWLVEWARAARAGQKVLAIGHTDVDPVTYASTTQVAEETIRLSGGPLHDEPASDWARAGGCVRQRGEGLMKVYAFDRRKPADAKLEHGDALTVWGDELVAWAAALTAGEYPPIMSPEEWDRAAAALAAPFEPVLDVAKVVVDTVARLSGLAADQLGAPSHGWRCSVAESIADAKANGKWHPRGSGYKAKRGDVICGARAGEEPELGGRGHYETITAVEEGYDPTTIGGNEANGYVVDVYRWDNPAFRGVIEVDAQIGEVAVELALAEMRAGVRELPGGLHHKQIQAYHAGARRGGSSLAGMPGHELEGVQVLGSKAPDEVDWCASSGGWRMYQAVKLLTS